MSNSILASIDVSKLTVLEQYSPVIFWSGLLLCLLAACALIILAKYLSRPRKTKIHTVSSHSSEARSNPWRIKVNEIVKSYDNQDITKEEAFLALAQTARDFASNATGRNMASHTLLDLNLEARNAQQRGLDMLRRTIAALYPPEFADALINAQARETSVDEASGWVLNLIDRWGR
ncbi:hypothetical protein [Bifidobacterium sp.]|jgi:hypothetical protein|uniref:hypothetical protein n=1 Tax=Bifidobacterium sp. TaxID=41200 RepID=UPI0025BD8975|nr:hypothetical protein [Bifidobacterium sp.]MCH4160004.1 hypothetical protein [Bifidobacterium sp.]MCH4175748.1 hypothetical protein [Bifidobacterium sp.]MCI1635549.1 hypothetical protein [Bifidobacterium sp.]